ncbi:MAG TPA: cupin domain-containing protein [Nannocystaceae bacterium]|nr:cupin domain-containing protein [Nannocystaceae bacterium]
MVMPKGMQPPAPECHPTQTEDFTVLRGTLDLGVVDGRRVVLNAGDTFHLPAGVYHLPANRTDDELEFEAVLTPGLESAEMFGDLYTVMREHRGLGQFARVAMVFRCYRRTITFKPVVRLVMRIVAGVASAVRLKARARAVGPAS